MLVLSRKIGREILIGGNVRITVTKVSGNRVTLGIEAPDNVRILRGELVGERTALVDIDANTTKALPYPVLEQSPMAAMDASMDSWQDRPSG